MDLLEALREKQKEMGLSDRQMSKRLGVTQPLWAHTVRGDVRIGRKILARVLHRWPELAPLVVEYLASEDPEGES